jgi:predicted dehydrogenase
MAKFKAVVVGAGGISGAWFPPLAKEKVEVVGVVDLNIESARACIAKNELQAEASDDLKATLKRVDPDFVIDLTIPEAHCNVTCTALRAGYHVIGEKPMAASMAEARRMVKAAETSGKLYMVGQSRRWDQKHELLRRIIAKGRLGTLTTANCDFYLGIHFGGFRDAMESPLILDMAIHHFDMARMITGEDPVAVYAHESNPSGSWYAGDVAATCIFEMTNGVIFNYRGSWCAEGCGTSWNGDWRMIGEKGTALYDHDQTPHGEVVVPSKKSGFSRPLKELSLPACTVKYTGQHGALREMLSFLRTGKTPQTECHDNIKSLAMVFAAMQSARTGRRIKISV